MTDLYPQKGSETQIAASGHSSDTNQSGVVCDREGWVADDAYPEDLRDE